MTINLKHPFVSAKADGTDASKIQPSNWNALHQLTAAAKRLLGRYADTDGDVQEISVGSGLDLSDAGVLSAPNVVTGVADVNDQMVLSANGADFGVFRQNPVYGTLCGFLGDSITFGNGSTNAGVTAWVPHFQNSVGGLLVNPASINAGTAGDTSALALARLPVLLAQNIRTLFVLLGANDANNGVSLATYTANMTAIVTQAQAAGASVFLCTPTPRSSGAAAWIHASLAAFAIALEVISVKYGCRYIDTNSALADPATGYLKASMDSDGLHPNNAGHYAIAMAVANAVWSDALFLSPRIVRAPNAYNHVSNPLMQGGTTLPTGYSQEGFSSGSTAVYSTVAPSDTSLCKNGKMLQIAVTAIVDTAVVVAVPVYGTAATGDQIALSFVCEIDDTSGNWTSLGNSLAVYYTAGGMIKGGTGDGGYLKQFGPVYFRYAHDAAGGIGAYIWATLKAGSTANIRIGELGLINETQAGVAA